MYRAATPPPVYRPPVPRVPAPSTSPPAEVSSPPAVPSTDCIPASVRHEVAKSKKLSEEIKRGFSLRVKNVSDYLEQLKEGPQKQNNNLTKVSKYWYLTSNTQNYIPQEENEDDFTWPAQESPSSTMPATAHALPISPPGQQTLPAVIPHVPAPSMSPSAEAPSPQKQDNSSISSTKDASSFITLLSLWPS